MRMLAAVFFGLLVAGCGNLMSEESDVQQEPPAIRSVAECNAAYEDHEYNPAYDSCIQQAYQRN